MENRRIVVSMRKALEKRGSIRMETRISAVAVSCERKLGEAVQRGIRFKVIDGSLEIYSSGPIGFSSSSDEGEVNIAALLKELRAMA